MPLPAQFVITCNDVDKTPDSVTWDDATHLSVDYSEADLTVEECWLRYSAKSPLFLSVADELITPFDLRVTLAV